MPLLAEISKVAPLATVSRLELAMVPLPVQRQRAGVDRGGVGVAVVARDEQRAGAVLVQSAAAADVARDGNRVAAVERQDAVVDDRAAAERTGGAAVADLQRATADRRRAAVAVVAGQDQRAGTLLGERAAARDVGRQGRGVGEVGDDRAPVEDGPRHQR